MHACQTWMPSMCVRVIWKKIQKRRERNKNALLILNVRMQCKRIQYTMFDTPVARATALMQPIGKQNTILHWKIPLKLENQNHRSDFVCGRFVKLVFLRLSYSCSLLMYVFFELMYASSVRFISTFLVPFFSVRETINSGQLTSTHWFNRRESSHLKHSFWNSIKSWAHQRN